MRERCGLEREVRHLNVGLEGGGSVVEAVAEHEASNEALPRFTPGEFGKAWSLSGLHFPDVVVTLLQSSRSFMKIAASLDKRYASLWDKGRHIAEVPQHFDKGVITTGRFQGRRVLDVRRSDSGSFFRPFGPLSSGYYDVIQIDSPDSANLGGWVELIAHETAHAFLLGSSKSKLPPTAPLQARITESIDEEILARKIEAKVFAEAKTSRLGKKELNQVSSTTGARTRRLVERDFAEIGWLNTYLESFVLEDRKVQAIQAEKLSDQDIARLNALVDAIPLDKRPLATYLTANPEFFDPQLQKFRKFKSEYAKARFFNRVLDARWREFKRQPANSPSAKSKEDVLQQHAAALFPSAIRYTK